MNKRGLFQTISSGTVTQANMKLSGVGGGATASGGAFVDWGYKYQSDFSVGEDGWAATNGTVNGNIDSIGGQDNTLRFTCNTGTSNHRISITKFTVGKKYTVTFKYYIPSGQSNLDGISLNSADWGTVTSTTLNTLDAWVQVTKTFTANNTLLRFYSLDGVEIAFTDAGGDDVFYIKDITIVENPPDKYIGHLLRIKDSAGKQIQGFIKSAGTGETTGSDLLAGWDFTSGWTLRNAGSAIVDSNSFSATGSSGGLTKTGFTVETLYKVIYARSTTSSESGIYDINVRTILPSQGTAYKTFMETGIYLRQESGGQTDVSQLEIYKVLTPSSTGVTIVSTKGGATYNWFNKNSSFNWNDTAGYTYEIVRVNTTTAVVDSNTTAANEHVSLVDGNAFYFGSVDMTNYQDGRHYLWMKDVSGYVAFAKIKAEVPGGEALGTEKLTGWTNRAPAQDYETFTTSGKDITSAIETGTLGQADSNTFGSIAQGSLNKFVSTVTKTSGADISLLITKPDSTPWWIESTLVNGANTLYITATNTGTTGYAVVSNIAASNWSAVNSFKQITECVSTGAHLMNAAGIRNMIYQHPSFNANAIANIKVLYYGD